MISNTKNIKLFLSLEIKKSLFFFPYSILIIIIFSLLSITYSNNRPDINHRKFYSKAVEFTIIKNKNLIYNQKLAEIYENCFPNTLDTTVFYDSKNNDTFIITGDIEAMWLRDSSFQVLPYISFVKNDTNLKSMFYDLIQRQSKSILIDPYANAFNRDEFNSPWQNDETYKLINGKRENAMNKKLWERKFELDSLISPLYLAYNYIEETKDFYILDKYHINKLTNKKEESLFVKAIEKILEVVKKEMRGTDQEDREGGPQYFFQRTASEPFDSLHHGRGNPVASCGLVKSMFRNSDDSSLFAYSIPENAFLVATFKKLARLIKDYIEITNTEKGKKFIFNDYF